MPFWKKNKKNTQKNTTDSNNSSVKTSDISTQGNTVVGNNEFGKNTDLRSQEIGYGISFSGTVNNQKGSQNVYGGKGHTNNQTVNLSDSDAEVNRLLERADKKLDEKGKELLDEIIITVCQHAEKLSNWKTDSELFSKIRELVKKLEGELNRNEIEKICQSEFEKAKELVTQQLQVSK